MNNKLNILLIGSGGREHAFVKAFNRSPSLNKLYVLPGNGGINSEAESVNLKADNFEGIKNFCKNNNIDLVVVGPEAPLVDGLADFLEAVGIKVFGPSKAAAQLEGSKKFMKEVVAKYGVPTAEFQTFIDAAKAKIYVREKGVPIVIKTDGLAAGKGVTVALTQEEAVAAIDDAFNGKFGEAGKKLIIEEFLEGEEVSFFVITDGKTVFEFGSAQDHKRAYDGDKGPNTGGMGTYSPAPVFNDMVRMKTMKNIIEPTILGLAKDGIRYKGFLFAGLMIDKQGNPKLLEYNIRMGDPETQVILPRLESDLADILCKAADNRLHEVKEIRFSPDNALCVVMAAKGYPEKYAKDFEIDLSKTVGGNAVVYHAGTELRNNKIYSIGGRVLGITGKGKTLQDAYNNAYSTVANIKCPGLFYRTDIGYRELKRK